MAFLLSLCILLARQQTNGDPSASAAYQNEIETWRAQRVARLTADGGWLTLVGLVWLEPGVNRFGTDPATNEIVLPAGGAPAHAGVFRLAAGRVTVEVAAGVPVTRDGKPITRGVLRTDAAGEPDVLALGTLTLQIIARGDRLGVRLKDLQSPTRRHFGGLKWYPVRPQFRVIARFVPHPAPTTIAVPSVIGVADAMVSPGSALFELGGKSFRLDPVIEPGETRLFFIFRDATSGHGSYGAGRFLYAAPPQGGHVVLDFNKAYAPPCAFTPYATCPLPPPQNRLPIAIEAGEMTPGP